MFMWIRVQAPVCFKITKQKNCIVIPHKKKSVRNWNKLTILIFRFRTAINVLGDSIGAGLVYHLSKKELEETTKGRIEGGFEALPMTEIEDNENKWRIFPLFLTSQIYFCEVVKFFFGVVSMLERCLKRRVSLHKFEENKKILKENFFAPKISKLVCEKISHFLKKRKKLFWLFSFWKSI